MNLAIVSNPRRRKHSKRRRKAHSAAPKRRRRRARRAAPRRHRRHHTLRLRRNPIRRRRRGGFARQGGQAMTGLLIPGALGAAGALGFDFLYGKVSSYLPAALQGNYYVSAGLKLVAAFGVAKFGRKVMKPQTAVALASGIAVVTLYDVAQILTARFMTPAPAPAAAATPGVSGRVPLSGRVALGYAGSGMTVGSDSLPQSALTGANYGYGYDG